LDEFGMSGVFTDVLVRESGVVIRGPRRVFVVHGREIDETIVCAVDTEIIIHLCAKIHVISLERGTRLVL
jgi:hypothetical protein